MVKDFENTGYWTLVLGGSSGLGLASAIKLASHGMNIIILHRTAGRDMELAEQEFNKIRAMGVELFTLNADALNAEKRRGIIEDIKQRLGQEGTVRCLLHSIAKGNLKAMAGINTLQNDDMNITMNAMAFSLYDWVSSIFEAGLFSDDARIISFSSEGSIKAWPYYGAVSAAKAALEAISRNIALEFASYGIRSNCIMAGVTDTTSMRMIPGSDKLAQYAQERNPYKRLTTPQDVANAVYLLCLDEAAWINGAVIPVNGGEHLQ